MRHGLGLVHLWFITDCIELTTCEISGVFVSCNHRIALEGSSSSWLSLRFIQKYCILLNLPHLFELPLEILILGSQVLHNFILKKTFRKVTQYVYV